MHIYLAVLLTTISVWLVVFPSHSVSRCFVRSLFLFRVEANELEIRLLGALGLSSVAWSVGESHLDVSRLAIASALGGVSGLIMGTFLILLHRRERVTSRPPWLVGVFLSFALVVLSILAPIGIVSVSLLEACLVLHWVTYGVAISRISKSLRT
ncbi:MAG: hypothetical protein QF805_05315 [Pirellulaceae bacterium]|jgi:hypothetical protein|nr:hypothetical protein [Pirellulaceae bacterium]